MFEDLLKTIAEQVHTKPHVVVAITGFGGSGKSTLADRLREHFKINEHQVLRVDHLYAPKPRGTSLFDDYDWPLIENILKGARDEERLHYLSRSFENETHITDEPLPNVIIFEGIQLFRKELMAYYNVSVWVDCPLELALQRANARDISQGHDADYMERWDTEWEPKSRQYYDDYRPNELANFIYTEYK